MGLADKQDPGLREVEYVLRCGCRQRRKQTYRYVTGGDNSEIRHEPMRPVARQYAHACTVPEAILEHGSHRLNFAISFGPGVIIAALLPEIAQPDFVGTGLCPVAHQAGDSVVQHASSPYYQNRLGLDIVRRLLHLE